MSTGRDRRARVESRLDKLSGRVPAAERSCSWKGEYPRHPRSRQVGDIRLSLLIECKKNNPNFVNWMVFRKTDELQQDVRWRLGGWTNAVPLTWQTKQYFPTIVTTARLHLCSFDPEDVNGATGEIASANASISEQKVLVFKYPLCHVICSSIPRHRVDVRRGARESVHTFTHLHCAERALPDFLRMFYGEPSGHEETTAPGAGSRA